MNFISVVAQLLAESGFAALSWQQAVMILISFVLMYLAIKKQFEPLLLLPISFGIFLTNLPLTGMMEQTMGSDGLATSPRAFWALCTTPVLPPSCSPASCSWPWVP